MTKAIQTFSIYKSFESGTPVLKGIDLSIAPGEMVALIGASGSGKSTLIRAIAGIIPVDKRIAGTAPHNQNPNSIEVFGAPMQRNGKIVADAKQLRARVGVVFQQFNLVPRLSVMTNVLLGLLGQIAFLRGAFGRFRHEEKQRAMLALKRVGIAEHALKRGADLSGGQQQRAAIARTLIQGADVIIADEPIASLDPNAARRVMDILANLNLKEGITILVSLHQVEYALKYCKRAVALRNGEIVYDGSTAALTPAFLGDLYGAESKELFLPGLDDTEDLAPPADDTVARVA